MTAEEKLSAEVKTNVTPSMRKALEEIAKNKGPGSKLSDVVREAVIEYLDKRAGPQKRK